jgi:hypothetical protein
MKLKDALAAANVLGVLLYPRRNSRVSAVQVSLMQVVVILAAHSWRSAQIVEEI